MSTITYLRNFIKDKNVASVTPSSLICVKRVCRKIDFKKKNVIVEYGPATGVFTKFILKNMNSSSRLIAIELNSNFADELRKISDNRLIVVNDNVKNVSKIVTDTGFKQVDYIISGIPFSFLNHAVRMKILEQTRNLLKENGKFLAYQTSGHLKKPLQKIFGNLHTEFELLNIPPMVIYEAIKYKGNIS